MFGEGSHRPRIRIENHQDVFSGRVYWARASNKVVQLNTMVARWFRIQHATRISFPLFSRDDSVGDHVRRVVTCNIPPLPGSLLLRTRERGLVGKSGHSSVYSKRKGERADAS